MVKVVCNECGKEYELEKGENPSDFTCECGGALEERRDISDVRTVDKSETKSEDSGIKETKYCSNCAEEIDYKAEICPKCGVRQPKVSKTTAKLEEKTTKYCSNCASEIDAKAEICPKCGVRQPGVRHQKGDKSPILAVILSFFIPGLGQFYNGHGEKGIILLVGGLILGVVTFLTLGLGGIIYFALWIFAMFDAFDSADRINKGKTVKVRIQDYF